MNNPRHFPHFIAGMRVTFDVGRESMDRVVDIEVQCIQCEIPKYEPWDKDKVYALLVSDFLMSGGDGYEFEDGEIISRINYGKLRLLTINSDSVINPWRLIP